MHIKEIILEGFKSYAHRTVVSGFDPHFNAITGLNGSGKSNILDAILFVLGINNPSQVRVLNWAGLIYKKAQGDIQKASVAIVFDNTDPETSPAGYQNQAEITVTRQIMANGKNKYLINGHNAQVSAVQNLFHSVRLNINNPHFLVMQGMITKVINMKPAEILAMIEEAAGTRMYEEKKQKAFKTIEKKQTKVDEIRRIVADEIAPKLEKLRDEQKNYIQWTSNKKEIERLQRFSIAFSFGDAMKVVESNEVNVAAEVANRDQLLEQQANLQAEIVAIEKQISALTPEDLEQENQRLRKKVETLSTEYIKITSNLNNIRDNILDEEKQAEAVEAAIAQVLAKVDRKEEKAQSIQKTLQELEAEAAESRAMYENLSRTFQEALTGTKSKDSNAKSWADRVMEAEQELINAQSGLEQERKMTEIRRRQLTQKKKEFGSSVGSNTLQQDFEQAKNEVDQLTQQIQGLQRAKQQFEELKQNKSAIERETGGLNEKWEEINGRLGNFQFQFSDPVKGFDRSKVKGRVGQQVRMKNPSRDALALEVSAGAKIQNLIVDSSETAKLLLERGRLQESVTMIPLNKIQSNPLKDSKVQLAKRLVGADNVDLALNLIDFDAELEPAMRFAFGSTLICKDLDSARTVAFHDEIRCRAVTLQGDVVDPAGTISGGSRKSQVVRLLLIHEHQQIETTLRRNSQQLADIDRELNSLQGQVQEYTRFEQKLLLKQTDLNIIQQRLQSTTYHKLQTEIADLEAALQKSSSTTEQLTARIEAANVNLQALKRDSSSSSSDSSSSIEQLQQQLVKTETLSRKKTDAVKKQNEMLNRVKLETQQLHDEISVNKEKLAQISARIDELQAEELKQNQHFEEFDVSYRAEKDKMEKYTQKINSTRTEITQLNQRKTQTIAQLDRAALELKKVENNLLNLEKNKNDAKLAIDHLLKAHPWISSEADLFGQPGTDYDFSTMTHNQSKRNLEKLRQQQDKLSRSINQKVMNMFEMAEEEYKELKKKEQIILDDKVRIESFINNLEEKKKEALVATWQSVNECFGNIFAKLLPGWSSKLEPPANQTIMDGLEVKFARGGVWKDSLSELSGGQRSLLALSLILAMLRIKPAPVYILDEVDSALDLSNTQNIGLMLKEYFDQSQFLIVSLKDGMWNNANVLFKTKFVDGSSTVTRHAKLAR